MGVFFDKIFISKPLGDAGTYLDTLYSEVIKNL